MNPDPAPTHLSLHVFQTTVESPRTRLLIGVVFHVLFIVTVWDSYFVDDAVRVSVPQHSVGTSNAQRLVLFVADGLRADLLFTPNATGHSLAPYLRSITETRGAFGISHTRVPTESRAGHVALIGGSYNYISRVTNLLGQRDHFVNFDTVFNQSSTTFAFGSQSIMEMFWQSYTGGNVDTVSSYPQEYEDYSKGDPSLLDSWVLNELQDLFRRAQSDHGLNARLRGDKVIFFLHFLGLDINGHTFRPHSNEYMENIRLVDQLVADTERLLREFYDDGSTAFIFTSDHGMSAIGNHGDGEPYNTRTPLIAWGEGVRGPLPDPIASTHDTYSEAWRLTHLIRRDVEQADITAIVSALLGIDWPVSSIGILPDVSPSKSGYLLPKDGNKTLSEAALVNAQVLLEHLRVRHNFRREHTFRYQLCPQFKDDPIYPGKVQVKAVRHLMDEHSYMEARWELSQLVQKAQQCLRYMRTYDSTVIRNMTIVAYLGWMVFSFSTSGSHRPSATTASSLVKRRTRLVYSLASLVLIALWMLFYIERAPLSYYFYALFPCFFWSDAIVRISVKGMREATKRMTERVASIPLYQCALVSLALASIVMGYTYRIVWSAGLVVTALTWPVVVFPGRFTETHHGSIRVWQTSCFALAIFPMLSVHRSESVSMISIGAFSICFYIVVMWKHASTEGLRFSRPVNKVVALQLVELALSQYLIQALVGYLQLRKGVPLLLCLTGWIVIGSALFTPLLMAQTRTSHTVQHLSWFIGLATSYLWHANSVEPLFLTVYYTTLFSWIEIETALRRYLLSTAIWTPSGDTRSKSGDVNQVRVAMFVLFLLQVGFFGAGNSFYLQPVYRLVQSHHTRHIAALIILKIMTPSLLLGLALSQLCHRMSISHTRLGLLTLGLADVSTMIFFLNVSDQGSWQVIGRNITYFAVYSLLLASFAMSCVLGDLLLVLRPGKGAVMKHDIS